MKGWATAAAAITKVTQGEYQAWVDNRELPPWMRGFLKLE
jgi:hypothetical protein